MAGSDKFDFVGAFRDSPITCLNWGVFLNLAPSIKRDIWYQHIQQCRRHKGKGKGKVKMVTFEDVPGGQEVSAVVTDLNLGEVINFYTKGIGTKEKGGFCVTRSLVDAAASGVNLMAIHLHQFMGAKLRNAAGIVILLH